MRNSILNRKKVHPDVPVFTGVRQVEEISLQLFTYNKDACDENDDFNEGDLTETFEDHSFHWLNIHGIHDADRIKTVCSSLHIHSLVIQDILDINQRPKFQEYDQYWFFTLKSILPSDENSIDLEQLSFILGSNYLISFQEKKADYFNHIRERLRNNIGIVRERGTDYLLFLLLEAILDNYFKTINDVRNKTNSLELFNSNNDVSPKILNKIELLKRHIHLVKNTILPIKEFIAKIEREQFNFVNEKHIKYYYELKDLCLSLIDECERIELKLESNTNLFFSIQGHRMNEIMKTLTIVATIFIPLTFIAGIYGMNFTNMPELSWKYGYGAVWILIIITLVIMILFFKRKKWL